MPAACEKRPTLKKLLVESRPKRPGARTDLHDNVREVQKPAAYGNSRAYLEDRLARDFPDHWRDYINGSVELDPATVAWPKTVVVPKEQPLSHQPHIPATAARRHCGNISTK